MPPALPSSPAGIRVNKAAAPKVVIEAFMDLACPFSGRMFETVFRKVVPSIEQKHPGTVEWVWHIVPQPWHPQSTLLNEGAVAVNQLKPELFFDFVGAVYAVREEQFIDDVTYDKTRSEIYDALAVVAESVGVDKTAFREKLNLKGKGNTGTFVTQDLKFAIKHHRTRGIHVTPTVLVNGIEAAQISSGWTEEQWDEVLQPFLTTPQAGL
eukprot:m.479215 g.479215  ORF g.479215 m.479215 type:complete len:210 (-) comp21371_c0_seq1:24-653(-)